MKDKIRVDHAVEFFGSIAKLAKVFDISVQAVYKWGEYVPELKAYKLREMHPREFTKR